MVGGEVGVGCPCNGGWGGSRAGRCQARHPKVGVGGFVLTLLPKPQPGVPGTPLCDCTSVGVSSLEAQGAPGASVSEGS